MLNLLNRWISVAIGTACFILFLPGIFTEFNVAQEERELERIKKKRSGIDLEGNKDKLKKPDYFAVGIMVVNYFLYLVNFVILETWVLSLYCRKRWSNYFIHQSSVSGPRCAWTSLAGQNPRPSST